jgi:uncharacterized protein YgiM (DUF1202 family)
MKTNSLFILGLMLTFRLTAQQVTNAPAAPPLENPAAVPATTNAAPEAIPAPAVDATSATNAPATKAAPKKTTKKKSTKKSTATAKKAPSTASKLKITPLVPGPATVAANNVNVRGQGRLKGEVIGKLTKGQEVTVIEEIMLRNSGPEEPSAWAKIAAPSGVHAWVNATFLDLADKTVKARKLNIRGGPGENFSVIGQLKKGDSIKEVGSKGDWIEIEPPAGTYAFVAARYLKQGPAEPTKPVEIPVVASTTPAEQPGAAAAKPAEPATVTEPPAVAAAPTTEPAATTPAATDAGTAAATPAGAGTPAATTPTETPATEPAADEPPPKRIVMREGIVRGTSSIQAPTQFELYSPETGRVIDFLYSPSKDFDLRQFKGMRIIVTGEEGLDERWRNTPVLTLEKVEVLQ